MLQLPTSYADLMKTVGVRAKGDEGSVLRARLWLSCDIPLNLSHLLLLLRLISVANDRIRHVVQVRPQLDLLPCTTTCYMLLTTNY